MMMILYKSATRSIRLNNQSLTEDNHFERHWQAQGSKFSSGPHIYYAYLGKSLNLSETSFLPAKWR